MVATTLPAVVRVIDLPLGTTVTGAELFEAVQTTAGVGQSVQLSASQILSSVVAILPTGGATGTILNKSSGSNYSTQFSAINTFVNIGTSLATTGSATSIVLFVPNQAITSTQLLNNAVGTNQVASSLGIASSLSVGTILTVGGTATFNGPVAFNSTASFNSTTVFSGGLNVTGTSLLTGTFGVVGTALFTGGFNVSGTAQFTGAFNVVGTTLFTGVHGIVGTTLVTGVFGQVGTSLMTGAFGVSGTAAFTGTFGIVGTTVITGTLGLSSLTAGVLVASSTGAVSNQGGMVLLNTLSPNGVASTNDTTSFTASYRSYLIMFDNLCPAVNTTFLQLQVATSGSNFISANYFSYLAVGGLTNNYYTSALLLSGSSATTLLSSSTVNGVTGSVTLFAPSASNSKKSITGLSTYMVASSANSTSNLAVCYLGGNYDGTTSPITGVNFLFNSGNISTGTIKIFGLT